MKEITKAILKAQAKFPTIKKESENPFFKNKYAGLDSILPVIMPILTEAELVLVQSPVTEGERIGVNTKLIHSSGEMIESTFTVQLSKNDPQGAGSAITYCRRYAIVSMLTLNCDKDDDANVASTPTVKKDSDPKVFTKINTDEI